MRYAVIGARGQLGRDLCPRLPGEVMAFTRDQIDLTQPAGIRPALEAVAPDLVVNCAAYNFVDKAEAEPDAAFAANTWGPKALAEACRDLRVPLLHFSTDYVFGLDPTRDTPFSEVDAPGPVGVYGLSKLAGEYAVRATWEKSYVVRVCGLYGVWGSGGKGTNFVETMLRVAGQGKPLKVVADQRCTPTYTADVAVATAALVQTGRFGLYHYTNAGACSWYEFARRIFAEAGVSADLSPISTAEFGAKARRPGYSVLACDKYQSLGLPAPRPWTEALGAYLHEREKKAAVAA